MREKLNDNPMMQLAVIGLLIAAAAIMVMGPLSSGGAEEEGEETSTAAETLVQEESAAAQTSVAGPIPTLPPPGSGVGAAPPAPAAVRAAFSANDTVVLLFVRNGGIDDRMVRGAVERLRSTLPDAAPFVVPARRVARYASIAQGVSLNRVPALVVLRPRSLDRGIPSASIEYGFQDPQSVVQAVIDAGYKGRTIPYHP